MLGIPVAVVGLRLTRFETTEDGRFYTPNIYIGVGLCLLVVVRLAYRVNLFYATAHALHPQRPAFLQSSLTLFLFGVFASFNIIYYSGVFFRSREPQLVPNR